MAETANIAAMAEKISADLFGEFLWSVSGPINQNWACEQQDIHKTKTHPTDVVFAYDEPYAKKRTYLQCDLKSYAKGSITATTIRVAMLSLANQVSCAEVSSEWQGLYTHGDSNYDVCGLLFVYNHDGEYDKEFSALLNDIKNERLDLPTRSRIYVLGPDDIYWLDNVRFEVQRMRGATGANTLPSREHCSYHYPQLARKANLQNNEARAATLEMLTSPWITLRYKSPNDPFDRYIVFVRRPASKPEEYEYLIDYLRHYQLLENNDSVTIKVLSEHADSSAVWAKAVDRYIANVLTGNGDTPFAASVKSIKFRPMTQVISSFSSIALGMDDGRDN